MTLDSSRLCRWFHAATRETRSSASSSPTSCAAVWRGLGARGRRRLHEGLHHGPGIGDAFRDAELCATGLHEVLSGKRAYQVAMADYQTEPDCRSLESMRSRRTRDASVPAPGARAGTAAAQRNEESMNAFARVGGAVTSPAEFLSERNVVRRLQRPARRPSRADRRRPDVTVRTRILGWTPRARRRGPPSCGARAAATRGRRRSIGASRRGVQAFGQRAGAAERDVVAAVDLVGLDAETLTGMAACRRRAEHAVVAAEQVPGRRNGSSLQRPWFAQRPRRLVARSPPRRGGERDPNVVVEDVVRLASLPRSPTMPRSAHRGPA